MNTQKKIQIDLSFLKEAFKKLPKNDIESPLEYFSPTLSIVKAGTLSLDRDNLTESVPSLRVSLMFKWDAESKKWVFQGDNFEIVND